MTANTISADDHGRSPGRFSGWLLPSALGRRAVRVALAIALSARVTSAQESLDQPFTEGFALPHFQPAPAGDRFFSVPDAGSFTDRRLRLMALGAWAYSSSLSRTDNQTGETRDIVSSQLYLHANAAYPIVDWLHAHADLPFAAMQNGEGPAAPESPRLGDLRLGLRANVLSRSFEAMQLGPSVDVWVPTGSEDELTGDGSVRVNPRVAMSGRAGAFIYSANLGYLFRKELDTGSLEIGDAFTFSGAAGVALFDDILQVGGELYGNTLTSNDNDAAEVTPLSALFGARVRIGDAVLGAAAGPGLTEAPGVAPRVVFSVALAPSTHVEADVELSDSELDQDGDGIVDADDACPEEPGQTSPEPGEHGCPAEIFQPEDADSDGDGISDSADACPEKWGDPSDDAAKNGCPRDEAKVAQVAHDTDGDGVLDGDDACPEEAGGPSDGCPAAAVVAGAEAPAASGKPAVTFAGFHVFDDGSSRIFVKLTGKVPVEQTRSKNRVDYRLKGARVLVQNNENPLLTEHFPASVLSAALESEGKDAVLTIRLRKGVKPSHELTEHRDGSVTLHVDLPRSPP